MFVRDFAPDPIPHEHRNQRDRQARGGCHCIGFGERQWTEQPAFLRLQGEHWNERQRDDQQAEEQCRPHFNSRVSNDLPVLLALQGGVRMPLVPGLNVLVGVFDHDDCCIDHRSDGDRDATQRHDVGVDALPLHDHKSNQDADRQRHDGDQRRAQMPQKNRANQRNDNELLDELVREVFNGTVDQLATVVRRDDFDALGQARFQLIQFGLNGSDGFPSVLAAPQDHHAADYLTFTVKLADAPAHFRAELDMRNVP